LSDPNLKNRVAVGIAWMTAARAAVRVLGMVSTLVLARLLTPVDFGLVAIATAVAAGLELLTLFSFDVALVQRQHLTREHYDSAWTMNVLLGLALGGAVMAVAGVAADYYREPRLEAVMLIIGAKYILLGLANTGVVDFRRNLQFDKEFILQIVPKLAGIAVTIPLAVSLRDYRALIAGMVLTAAMTCLLSFTMHPHRPQLCFTKSKELFRFSRWLLISNVMAFLRTRAGDLIISRVLGSAALGTYSLAYEISNLPTTEMVAPINRVLLPGYVKVAEHPERLRDAFQATLGLIAIAILPVSVGIAAVSDPLVRVALGGQWLDAIPLITLLAVAGSGTILLTNTGAVFHALGKPHVITYTGAVYAITLLPMLLFGTYWYGLEGAAWAYVIHTFGPGVVLSYWVFLRTTPMKLVDIVRPCWRPVIAAPIMFIAVRRFLELWDDRESFFGALTSLFGGAAFGAVVYVSLVGALWFAVGRPEATETAILRRVGPLWHRLAGSFARA